LSSVKLPRITNIWSKVVENEGGLLFSRVVIESTGAFETEVKRQGNVILLEGSGVMANMPVGPVEVNDGLLRNVLLDQTGPDRIIVTIETEHPAEFEFGVTGELPVRTSVTLERSFITRLFQGKKIVVDPGHGGEDAGGRGPVNLVEKNVVMLIALNLKKMFEQAGAIVFLTRQGDQAVSSRERMKAAKDQQADFFISIHTHTGRNSKVSGAAVLYSPSGRDSTGLAGHVKEELLKKLKLVDRGLREKKEYRALGSIPAIEVEVVTITNWVEEGLLRSPTVHKKAAEGIFNGVKNYLAGSVRQQEVLA
jgi:N-acetylmuramoyl-L-alanine amidase